MIHFLATPLPEPWQWTMVDLTPQLQKELPLGHVLYGKSVKTLARRNDSDDVLFEIIETPCRYAIVHLTWSNRPTPYSDYPKTILYGTWEAAYESLLLDRMEFFG